MGFEHVLAVPLKAVVCGLGSTAIRPLLPAPMLDVPIMFMNVAMLITINVLIYQTVLRVLALTGVYGMVIHATPTLLLHLVLAIVFRLLVNVLWCNSASLKVTV